MRSRDGLCGESLEGELTYNEIEPIRELLALLKIAVAWLVAKPTASAAD